VDDGKTDDLFFLGAAGCAADDVSGGGGVGGDGVDADGGV